MRAIEQDLMLLSDAIAARYFLQGANAVHHRQTGRPRVIYSIRHRTGYKSTAAEHLRPLRAAAYLRRAPEQTVFSSSVKVTPAPSRSGERTGPFGEAVHDHGGREARHNALVIEAKSRIDVHILAPHGIPVRRPGLGSGSRQRSFETHDIGVV